MDDLEVDNLGVDSSEVDSSEVGSSEVEGLMGQEANLTILHALPEGLLSLDATELHTKLTGPTLIHLDGRKSPAVFFSVLLHGNEHTSWQAVRQLLLSFRNKTLPRAISIFIGNIEAARNNQRYIEGQQDFNRMWGDTGGAAAPLMQQVMTEMTNRGVFLSVDIHNNTGKNPHYACINSTEADFLYLASLFSRTVVYFEKPASVQSMAFSKLCPAVTVECGLSGDQKGLEHALEYITACVHLSEFPINHQSAKDVIVYHTVAVAKIPPQFSIGFDNNTVDINLDGEIEYYNFKPIPKNTTLGRVKAGVVDPLSIVNDQGEAVEFEYIVIVDGLIKTRKLLIPAMITKDVSVIRKDCFCYIMEEYPL